MSELVRVDLTTLPEREQRQWARLQKVLAGDVRSRRVQHVARGLWQAAEGDRKRFVQLAFAFVRDCLRYQSDLDRVKFEDFASADETLKNGVEDCDGKAKLFVALCRIMGIEAELVPYASGEKGDQWLSHVYAEVKLDGAWQNVEATLARARLGEVPDAVPRDNDGKWRR